MLDSGATDNIITDYLVSNFDKKKINGVIYTIANREFTTSEVYDIYFDMPEFSSNKC